MLTAERLKEVLDYDPETGIFTWKKKRSNLIEAGTIAGTISAKGYYVIAIDRKIYRASRLAWFYMVEEWPGGQIDHRNRVRNDDRWENLREAAPSQNSGNATKKITNSSGFKGVSYHACGKWVARIQDGKKYLHLGLFETPDKAHAAYLEKARELYGEFHCAG